MAFRSTLLAGLAAQAGAVWLAGVNLAGCEIGMRTDTGSYAPTDFEGQYKCPSKDMATSQIQHFANKDGFNVFRFPVPWQELIGNDLDVNQLDNDYMTKYDQLIQVCLDSSAEAHCIIDIHNYGRWWGQIVGEGGPSADALAKTWSQIASRYKDQPRIIFGTMNEPHDQDDNIWAQTLQTVVYAIRDAGATSQIITLSPTNHANAISLPELGNALLDVHNYRDKPDDKTNLIFEIHQYFDQAGGSTSACSDDGVDQKLRDITGKWLRDNNRQAFMGELGGGNDKDCTSRICPFLDVMNDMGDVFIGWTSWAAGNWWPDYELLETPNGDNDVGIVSQCFAPKFAPYRS